MKKFLSVLTALCILISMTACANTAKNEGNTSQESTSGKETTSKENNQANTEDPFAALGNFTMIVGHAQPEGNPRTISMEQFAKDVTERKKKCLSRLSPVPSRECAAVNMISAQDF